MHRDSLYLVTLWCNFVLPIEYHGRQAKDQGDIQSGVFHADTFVGAAAPDEIVSGVCVGRAVRVKPALGVKLLRRREDDWVVKGVEE